MSRTNVAWLGCVSGDTWLSTFASSGSVRELQRWDKTVTTNWILRNWGEKGVKNNEINNTFKKCSIVFTMSS
jgi:hypothetical protein